MKKLRKQVNDYLLYCRDIKRLSETTILTRSSVLMKFADEIPARKLSKITNKMIEEWTRKDNRAGSTVNEYTVEIKTMLKFFKSRGVKIKHLNLNELQLARETPSRKVFYSPEQIEKVLRNCDEMEWLLISLSFECGFRIHELTSLKLENIHGRKITFIGKGRKLREVYMSKQTQEKFEQYIKINKIKGQVWIKRYKNGEISTLSSKYLARKMKQAFLRCGFLDFYPHSLRHSFATNICLNGAPIEVAKEMLGHSDIKTTMRYIHSLEGRLESLFDKYQCKSVTT